jgi:hypothetical protein
MPRHRRIKTHVLRSSILRQPRSGERILRLITLQSPPPQSQLPSRQFRLSQFIPATGTAMTGCEYLTYAAGTAA